jgi:hypothetical protein
VVEAAVVAVVAVVMGPVEAVDSTARAPEARAPVALAAAAAGVVVATVTARSAA